MTEITFREEVWEPVPGWEGFYEVSSEGRVKSLAREVKGKGGFPSSTPERICKPSPRSTGYVYVSLSRDGESATEPIHRLVCLAFLGPPNPGEEVRHLNGVPYDNRSDNVAWGTPKENAHDKLRLGTNWEATKTHCHWGHEYTEDNTVIVKTPTGVGRQCRECKAIRGRVRVICQECGRELARFSFSNHKKKFHKGKAEYEVKK